MLADTPSELVPVPPRPGLPVEPRRLLSALRRSRKVLLGVAVMAVLVGVVLRACVLNTYAAATTILWEPPAAARADPGRELATLAQSVKLPSHMLQVRERTGSRRPVEAVAKAIDVTLGESSMLLTVTARASRPDEAARLAQTTVDVFMEARRESVRERLREVVIALRDSLSQAETANAGARKQYDAFRAENHVDDFPAEIQATIEQVAHLRVSVNDAWVELQGVNARKGALEQAQEKRPESVVLWRTEQNTDEARAGLIETELTEVRSRYAPDHPRVRVLEAELSSLRSHALVEAPTVSAQVVGRNAVRDGLSAQIEESGAMRSAILERTRAIDALRRETEARAAQLTSVQGEAARLLADVRANEEHVALLLKQLAMAEDDVHGASSGFQMVSSATPPEHPEHGVGRIVAMSVPLVVLLIAVLAVFAREIRGLRVTSASEAAFFAQAPVVWSTSWPSMAGGAGSEQSALARELADVCEDRPGVLGVTALGDAEAARDLAALLLDRLQRRGRRCTWVDATAPLCPEGATAADVLESGAVGAHLAELSRAHDHVIVLLPPGREVSAVRAAVRWLDGVLVVVQSGASDVFALRDLAQAASVRGRGVGVALVSVPAELLSSGHRGVGDAQRLFREAPLPRGLAPVESAGVQVRDGDGIAGPGSTPDLHARAGMLTNGAAVRAMQGQET